MKRTLLLLFALFACVGAAPSQLTPLGVSATHAYGMTIDGTVIGASLDGSVAVVGGPLAAETGQGGTVIGHRTYTAKDGSVVVVIVRREDDEDLKQVEKRTREETQMMHRLFPPA